MKYLAILWLDSQFSQVIFMGSHRAVQPYQQVTQEVSQWILLVFSDGGRGGVIVDVR